MTAARCIVVTGAADGIGKAVVARLLDDEATTCVAIDRDEERLGALVGAFGERVTPLVADVASDPYEPEFAERLAGAAAGARGLVNAAGNHCTRDSLDLERDEVRSVMAVHVEGSLRMAQLVVPLMAANGGGAIVNFSSVASQFGWPRRLPYAMAKAAIEAMTRTLAVEWAPLRIRVNAVAPGYVDTEMIRRSAAAGAFDRAQREAGHVLGRFASPAEIADVVTFLLGPGASYVTGQTVAVDGGFSVTKDVHPDAWTAEP